MLRLLEVRYTLLVVTTVVVMVEGYCEMIVEKCDALDSN